MKLCPLLNQECVGDDCVNYEQKRQIGDSVSKTDMEHWAKELQSYDGVEEFNRTFPIQGYCLYFKVWLGE